MYCDDLSQNRSRIGKCSGIVGIVCNALLALGKMLAGRFSGSVAIFADGLNNLSDAAGSVITLLAFRLAEKPADKHHPYGHARFEYLASLSISVLILFIGLELGKSSLEKLLHPAAVAFTPVTVWVLLASVAVKIGLAAYNRRAGSLIRSKVLLAAAADSRNDALTTAAVLLSGLLHRRTGLNTDGLMGAVVSCFILLSGISIARETISSLLGEGGDPGLRQELTSYILSQPGVLGCHDLMIHDYGPGRCYASIHAEMDRQTDLLACHGVIDEAERECLLRFGVRLVIHPDPVVNDPETQRMKALMAAIVRIRDPRLEIHDFRIVTEDSTPCLAFDLVLPEDLQSCQEELLQTVRDALRALDPGNYGLRITFDL